MSNIQTIVFDLGGVLIDWDPRYLYRKIFSSDEEIEHFLTQICTSDWNEQQDAGRPLEEATALLTNKHPEYKSDIKIQVPNPKYKSNGPNYKSNHKEYKSSKQNTSPKKI